MATVFRPSANAKARRSRKDPLIEVSPDLLTPTRGESATELLSTIIIQPTQESQAPEAKASEYMPDVPSENTLAASTQEAPVAAKRKATSPAAWYAHKKKVTLDHPELNSTEQLILAKKSYEPVGGRIRTAQSLHREAFLLRNPDHGFKSTLELDRAIRADLISRI